MGDTWTGQLTASGSFVPWTPSAFAKIGGESKFIPGVLPATYDPGKAPVDLMLFAESYAMFYNKALFQKAGIASPPATWSQFVADAKKLTDPRAGVWGVASDMANVPGMNTFEWILTTQYGGSFYATPTEDKATVNTAPDVKAMTFLLNWIGPDHIMDPDNAEYNNNQAEEQFGHGKAAMIFTQGSSFSAYGMPNSAWGVALLPMPTSHMAASQAVMSHLDGVNIGILKSSTHLAADYAWLKFLTGSTAQTLIGKSYGVIPSTLAASKDAIFTSSPVDKVWLDIQSHYAKPMPTQADTGTVANAYAAAVGQLAYSAASSGKVSGSQVQSALDSVESASLADEG